MANKQITTIGVYRDEAAEWSRFCRLHKVTSPDTFKDALSIFTWVKSFTEKDFALWIGAAEGEGFDAQKLRDLEILLFPDEKKEGS
jgi:hypothetical protein